MSLSQQSVQEGWFNKHAVSLSQQSVQEGWFHKHVVSLSQQSVQEGCISVASQPLFFFGKGEEKKKCLETLARFSWACPRMLAQPIRSLQSAD